MRIALRTGAGRGAYELAGTHGAIAASELFDKTMFYELTPNLTIPGYALPGSRQGKPRIILDSQRGQDAAHFYRVLAALLLMPKPRRELRKALGSTLIASGAYSMTAIKIDVVSIETDRSVVRPTEILLENSQGVSAKVNFVDRMSRILEAWDVASRQDSRLATLLSQHKAMFYASNISHKDIEAAAGRISAHIGTDLDPLQSIEIELGIEDIGTVQELTLIDTPKKFGVEDSATPEKSKIDNIKRWRIVATRGSAAIKFRSNITKKYRYTCLFTGKCLPKLEAIQSPGVDAAHILPWASHGINSVNNGICLSKQCHWAFDAGVIKLSFDRSNAQYVITIPEIVMTQAQEEGFSLEDFQRITGPIPESRLPDNQDEWPNPQFLDEFNSIMFA